MYNEKGLLIHDLFDSPIFVIVLMRSVWAVSSPVKNADLPNVEPTAGNSLLIEM